eukprot:SAG11_NODE_12548_length_697_cov_2.006689_1_plen_104_part_00
MNDGGRGVSFAPGTNFARRRRAPAQSDGWTQDRRRRRVTATLMLPPPPDDAVTPDKTMKRPQREALRELGFAKVAAGGSPHDFEKTEISSRYHRSTTTEYLSI